jgi:hypothetical protein
MLHVTLRIGPQDLQRNIRRTSSRRSPSGRQPDRVAIAAIFRQKIEALSAEVASLERQLVAASAALRPKWWPIRENAE